MHTTDVLFCGLRMMVSFEEDCMTRSLALTGFVEELRAETSRYAAIEAPPPESEWLKCSTYIVSFVGAQLIENLNSRCIKGISVESSDNLPSERMFYYVTSINNDGNKRCKAGQQR